MKLPKGAESRVGICVRYLGRFSNVESTEELSREVEQAFEELVPHEYSGIYLFNEKKKCCFFYFKKFIYFQIFLK
jgi:hypothetical protein